MAGTHEATHTSTVQTAAVEGLVLRECLEMPRDEGQGGQAFPHLRTQVSHGHEIELCLTRDTSLVPSAGFASILGTLCFRNS